MTKELEMLKDIEILVNASGIKTAEICVGNTRLKMELTNQLEVIRKSLTPPTADEVCEALSEHYGREVYYDNTMFRNRFHFKDSWVIVRKYDGMLHFTQDDMFSVNNLPPHLITLIGRFYEGQNNE